MRWFQARSWLRTGRAAIALRDWPAAQAAFQAAAEQTPGQTAAWFELGRSLREQGALDEALAAYRRAEAISPRRGPVHLQIARVLRLMGDQDGALASYERARALNPLSQSILIESTDLKADIDARDNPPRPGLPMRLRYIALGTTGLCNASCVHCPTGKEATAESPRFPMPMALFKKIIDGVADLNIPLTASFQFGLFGDGLVDPLVLQRAEYLIARLPRAKIGVNTNGAAFNHGRHARLNTYVSTVALHCESLIPSVYNDLMRPLRLERVQPKFEEILRAFPGKVSVSVPKSRRNLEELPDIRRWFLDRGAREVAFAPLSSRCAEDLTAFNALALDPYPIRCSRSIMDDLIVDCDGKVLMCCQDFQRRESIGDLSRQSVAEVIGGVQRFNARRLLAEGRHAESSTCSRCFADIVWN